MIDTSPSPSPPAPRLFQDVFDVTSVYFPITFTPPPNDPYGITQEALVAALLSVFRASPSMAEHVIPLALEKLSSTLINAKIDALSVIRECAASYGVERIAPFFDRLGAAISAELVDSEQADVAAQALGAVTELTALASGAWESTGRRSAWDNFVAPLVDTALQQVRAGTATLHGRASCKVLSAVAQASPHAFEHVLAVAMGLLKDAAQSESASQREVSICTMVALLRAVDPALSYPAGHHPLSAYLDDTLKLMRDTLRRGSVMLPRGSSVECRSAATPVTHARCEAAAGLALLAGTVSPHPLLELSVVTGIIHELTEMLGYDSDCEVRRAALLALTTLAGGRAEYAEVVIRRTVPMLMEGVPREDGTTNADDGDDAAPEPPPATTDATGGESVPGTPATSGGADVGSGAGAGAGAGAGGAADHITSQGCCKEVACSDSAKRVAATRALCLKKSLAAVSTLCAVPALFKVVVPKLMGRAVVPKGDSLVFSTYWGGKVAWEVMKTLAAIVDANKESTESMDSCIGVCCASNGAASPTARRDLMAESSPCSLRLVPTLLSVIVRAVHPPPPALSCGWARVGVGVGVWMGGWVGASQAADLFVRVFHAAYCCLLLLPAGQLLVAEGGKGGRVLRVPRRLQGHQRHVLHRRPPRQQGAPRHHAARHRVSVPSRQRAADARRRGAVLPHRARVQAPGPDLPLSPVQDHPPPRRRAGLRPARRTHAPVLHALHRAPPLHLHPLRRRRPRQRRRRAARRPRQHRGGGGHVRRRHVGGAGAHGAVRDAAAAGCRGGGRVP